MQMSQADRLSAIAFAALGLAMAMGGYTMERLEIRQIHPGSIPGLVPMVLGVLMVVCAVLLWRDAARSDPQARILTGGSWVRLGLTAGICLIYAVVLIGWLPFMWATALFVFAFAAVFGWPEGAGGRQRVRALCGAAILAVGAAWGTALLFAELFLVRLP